METKSVRLKDSHNTIILIDVDADSEQAAKKYVKDLQEYKYKTEKYLRKENLMAKVK